MPVIRLRTEIQAPREVVFDLSRSIDFHQASVSHTRERAVDGTASGLLELHQSVTWEAVHFGLKQRLTSRMVLFDRPRAFRDSMVRGAFRRFDHDHLFETDARGVTVMTDVFDYTSPLGPLGRLADALFLHRYMTRLLEGRNRHLKEVAESGEWKKYLLKETGP